MYRTFSACVFRCNMTSRKFLLILFGIMSLFIILLLIRDDARDRSNILTDYNYTNVYHYDPAVDLRIIAIVGNRSKSLGRLLNSLNRALYYNDNIVLEVWIDREMYGKYDVETYKVARSFRFLHGKKYIYIHSSHVGIFGQWINTWNASTKSSEIVVILEDDLEVSVFFYRWLKLVHSRYDNHENINGYSLHGTCENHSLKPHRQANIVVPKNNTVFLYPAFNTWGFSPNVRHWVHFMKWVSLQTKYKTFIPFVPNIAPSLWYQEALQKGSAANNWDMWHVYHAYMNKLFTMFPNIPGDLGFAIHWREKGLHYGENTKNESSGKLLLNWIPQIDELPMHPLYLNYDGRQINYSDYQWL